MPLLALAGLFLLGVCMLAPIVIPVAFTVLGVIAIISGMAPLVR